MIAYVLVGFALHCAGSANCTGMESISSQNSGHYKRAITIYITLSIKLEHKIQHTRFHGSMNSNS